jgi:uncharacterized protein DUF3592
MLEELFYRGVVIACKLAGSSVRGVRRAVLGLVSRNWPKTEAVIQAAICDNELGLRSARVEYEYRVKGRYYGGTFSSECFFTDEAEGFVQRFRVRDQYYVRYDPRAPERSYMPSEPMPVRSTTAMRTSSATHHR